MMNDAARVSGVQNGAPLWRAVAERDASADGLFVYAVRSTRVYCRPSCPSRRPNPLKVEYFPSPVMAAAAGYRACRRCRPDQPSKRSAADSALLTACAAIARAPETKWTAARLAGVSGAKPALLRRSFRRALGITPHDYVIACRRRAFHGHLRGGEGVTEAIYASGFSSPSGVYGVADGEITPAVYRQGAAGVRIEWLTVASPIGRVLVAATSKGVCFVAVGANHEELETAVRAEFPRAALSRSGSARLRGYAAAAAAVAHGRPLDVSLPADVAGTAFQWRVWRALTRIPRGERVSYAGLAKAVSAPAAIRAVGTACGANPLALVIPCHRVVGTDGTLRGYRWGLPVKRALLEGERHRES